MPSTSTRPEDENKRCVVLGATGRLGAVLRAFWQTKRVCWQSRTARNGFATVDILHDPRGLKDLCAEAHSILCLAGVTGSDPHALRHNTALALAAIDASQGARVVLTSSAAVYGAGGANLRETDICVPTSAYGQSKLEMEQAALATGAQVTCLRIGNVAGADAILGGWHPGMTLDARPDGATPRRSYIGPQTFARVLRHLVTADALPPILNIAAPGAVQMGALLDAAGLSWRPRTPDDRVIWDVTLNTEELARIVPIAPECGSASGIIADWRQAKAPS
ncbi:NAD-dependent epimerase/dehydratase family protein [Pseudosulfitobacter koreensis]|uniref:Sugar nucleotide-binding protein n=1 Tax=Pseudosulfitobacter koreensis TaxID=2968472 RepID=A0ABT1Z108_9RHOB|nr:NAD-dependent epimerase/dehydratase family protein [Pseudosulfitobacter koreense]MCR8826776.1 sugar nucleotide-binding protein [Pseudosulfitobacter koreense]